MVAVPDLGGRVAAQVFRPGFGGEVADKVAELSLCRKGAVGGVADSAFGGKVAAKVM